MTHIRSIVVLAVVSAVALAMFSLARGEGDKGKDDKSVDAKPVVADDEKSNKDKPDAQPERKDVSHFMRLKLDASGQILEGLAVEDFDLIKEGARKMNEMSTAEKWRVSNDAMYRNFSGDFQRVTQDLVKAAEEENLDRAALKWMDATMSCIECHRYSRGIKIADLKQQTNPGVER